MSLAKEYKHQREAGWQAWISLHHAKTQKAWDEAGGYEHEDHGYSPPVEEAPVRLRWIPEDCDYDSLVGDCFTLEAFQGNERALKAGKEAFDRKLEQDGVWCLLGEYWNGEEWVLADSIGMLVGQDPSGYEFDVMQETLNQWEALDHCPTCNRPI